MNMIEGNLFRTLDDVKPPQFRAGDEVQRLTSSKPKGVVEDVKLERYKLGRKIYRRWVLKVQTYPEPGFNSTVYWAPDDDHTFL